MVFTVSLLLFTTYLQGFVSVRKASDLVFSMLFTGYFHVNYIVFTVSLLLFTTYLQGLGTYEKLPFSYFHVIYRLLPCNLHGFYSPPFAIYNIFTGFWESTKTLPFSYFHVIYRIFHVTYMVITISLLLFTYWQGFGSVRKTFIPVFPCYLQDISM